MSKNLVRIIGIIKESAEKGNKFANLILERVEADCALTSLEQISIKRMIDEHESGCIV